MNSNTGNFLAVLELLATRDDILRKHLENGKKNCRYTSKTIQNKIINVIADYLRNKTTRDLTEGKISKYFCLIANEVTDTTTNKEVLSLCLRFLSGNDDPSSVNISEVFVDYVHLERTTGKVIADAIVKSLHDMGFDIGNLRGQGYDGASAMFSSIQGVNGRIREIAPLALYSHCKSHEYCIKLQADEYKEYDQFSERRIPILRQFQNICLLGKILDRTENASSKRKLQGLCKTRWAERHTCYETFHELYLSITVTLDAMLRPHEYADLLDDEVWSWDPDTRTKAQGLYSALLSFEFVMSFLVAKSCLEPICPITVKLQRSNIDSYEAYEMIDATIDRLKGYRNDIDKEFQEWFHAATTLVESAGGVVSQLRVSGRQQHLNYSSRNPRGILSEKCCNSIPRPSAQRDGDTI